MKIESEAPGNYVEIISGPYVVNTVCVSARTGIDLTVNDLTREKAIAYANEILRLAYLLEDRENDPPPMGADW
jgi:hypothetical protein